MSDLEAYFEQFRGDGELDHDDYAVVLEKVCRYVCADEYSLRHFLGLRQLVNEDGKEVYQVTFTYKGKIYKRKFKRWPGEIAFFTSGEIAHRLFPWDQAEIDAAPNLEDSREAICRARGQHDWFQLFGGFRCNNCGLQIPVHEPFNQATMVLVIARQAELDAELRKT